MNAACAAIFRQDCSAESKVFQRIYYTTNGARGGTFLHTNFKLCKNGSIFQPRTTLLHGRTALKRSDMAENMRSEFTQAETASDIAAKAEIAAPAALNAESKLPHSRKTNERYAIPPGTSGISATMSTAAFSRTNSFSKLHAIYAATTAANSEKNTKLFGKNKNRFHIHSISIRTKGIKLNAYHLQGMH